MANPQKENGYTPVAHEILEQVCKLKLNGTQFKIILIVWRYTYGFNRTSHELSLSFISNATECDKRQIQRELKALEEKNIITQKIKNGSYRKIAFNKNYDSWLSNENIGNGKSTNGENTNGETTKVAIGETTNESDGKSTNQERYKEKYKESVSVSGEEELKKNFGLIYEIYPKKTTKQSAYESYKKWIKGRKIDGKIVKLTNKQIYIAVSVYVKEKENAKVDLQYYKNFSTLMNQILDYVAEEGEEDAD